MKTLTIVLCLLTAGVAFGQMPSRDALIADALKEFANISGGMFINERCKFLNEADSQAFRTNVEGIQPVLSAEIGNPSLVAKIRDSAKTIAASEKYKPCGEDARKIVELTSGHAGRWYSQIRRIQTKGE